jgi:predicted nuclease of predicted toxin-antitoxin system
MKLLFDENLSPRLIEKLKTEFPESQHIRNLAMNSSKDTEIWEYAIKHEFAIVSKDVDFQQRSYLYGHPPKIVWIRIGNGSTLDIFNLLKRRITEIATFYQDPDASFLALS